MIVAVASGKGGTGKTTVALNLARTAGTDVQLLDCDVEAPNCHLFLNGDVCGKAPVAVPVPEIDKSRCNGCGVCSRVCEFNAIAAVGKTPLVFAAMCHGCGACTRVCSNGAIREVDHPIGMVETVRADNIQLAQGRLNVGAAMAPPVIRAVKRHIQPDALTVIDAPPGTSCPVIAAVKGADRVVLVAEPTPFGLHDLTLAVEMLRELSLPFGVVINRVGIGDDRVHRFCAEKGIPILAEIPDDLRIAQAYSRGAVLVEALPEYEPIFANLWENIKTLTGPIRTAADLTFTP